MVGTWDGNNNKANVYLKYPDDTTFCKILNNVQVAVNYKTKPVNILYIGGEQSHWNNEPLRFAGTIDGELHMVKQPCP